MVPRRGAAAGQVRGGLRPAAEAILLKSSCDVLGVMSTHVRRILSHVTVHVRTTLGLTTVRTHGILGLLTLPVVF